MWVTLLVSSDDLLPVPFTIYLWPYLPFQFIPSLPLLLSTLSPFPCPWPIKLAPYFFITTFWPSHNFPHTVILKPNTNPPFETTPLMTFLSISKATAWETVRMTVPKFMETDSWRGTIRIFRGLKYPISMWSGTKASLKRQGSVMITWKASIWSVRVQLNGCVRRREWKIHFPPIKQTPSQLTPFFLQPHSPPWPSSPAYLTLWIPPFPPLPSIFPLPPFRQPSSSCTSSPPSPSSSSLPIQAFPRSLPSDNKLSPPDSWSPWSCLPLTTTPTASSFSGSKSQNCCSVPCVTYELPTITHINADWSSSRLHKLTTACYVKQNSMQINSGPWSSVSKGYCTANCKEFAATPSTFSLLAIASSLLYVAIRLRHWTVLIVTRTASKGLRPSATLQCSITACTLETPQCALHINRSAVSCYVI